MLDLTEKIAHGFCALVVVTVGSLYLIFGTRDTVPAEFLPDIVPQSTPHRPSGSSGDGKSPVAMKTTNSKILAENKTLMQEIRKNNPRAGRKQIDRKYMPVPTQLYDYARKEVNWIPQLKHVGRQDLATKDGHSRVMLTHMPPNSLLRKFGLRPDDVIELIDGERFEVDPESSTDARARANELFDKLEGGEEVSITLTRNGQPVHLFFKLP